MTNLAIYSTHHYLVGPITSVVSFYNGCNASTHGVLEDQLTRVCLPHFNLYIIDQMFYSMQSSLDVIWHINQQNLTALSSGQDPPNQHAHAVAWFTTLLDFSLVLSVTRLLLC